MQLKLGDVLLIALSDEPLLNWWRLLADFSTSEDSNRCQTIVLVPDKLGNIQGMFARIQIINGTLPPTELKKKIVEQIRLKRDVLSSRVYERLCLSRFRMHYEVSRRPPEIKNQKRYYYCRLRLCSLMGVSHMHILFVIAPGYSASALLSIQRRL
ncbi:hypothetical protein ACSDH9_000476 [Cronobacter sakazakii]